MAELTQIEEKLAEVLGLAQAAQKATSKVASLGDNEQVNATLEQMGQDAAEAERRCTEVAAELNGKKTAVEEKARETKQEAEEMMSAYLGDDADQLDGLEFLIMAEAGELGHVEIVERMNQKAGDAKIGEVASWALEVQRRHWEQVRDAALTLAGEEDPNETA
jgi:hypothetical protein